LFQLIGWLLSLPLSAAVRFLHILLSNALAQDFSKSRLCWFLWDVVSKNINCWMVLTF
jgi:hypothetical protein